MPSTKKLSSQTNMPHPHKSTRLTTSSLQTSPKSSASIMEEKSYDDVMSPFPSCQLLPTCPSFRLRDDGRVQLPLPPLQVGCLCQVHRIPNAPTVAELMKDKLDEDIFAMVMSIVEHLYKHDQGTHWRPACEVSFNDDPCNFSPCPSLFSTFYHWKSINLDEDFGYTQETYLLANHRSVSRAREINIENRNNVRWTEYLENKHDNWLHMVD